MAIHNAHYGDRGSGSAEASMEAYPWTLGKMVQHLARRHEAPSAEPSPGLAAVAPPLLAWRRLLGRRWGFGGRL